MAVGELVPNAGCSGYNEEIVVATNTGLMWLHVDELAASGTLLPATGDPLTGAHTSGFWIEKDGPTLSPQPPPLADTQTQARTNQALQATWAMARRPGTGGLDPYLHLHDQRGVYWRVGYGGQVQFWEHFPLTGARGWNYVGTLSAGAFPQMPNNLTVASGAPYQRVTTEPFCPLDTENIVAELTNHYIPNNWMSRELDCFLIDGFYVYPSGGTVLDKPAGWISGSGGGFELWHWTFAPAGPVAFGSTIHAGQWGNLVQGMHAKPSGEIDGLWASTHTSTDRCSHHRLRSFNGDTASINQQAIAAVNVEFNNSNETALILGCPGGRIRVCVPGGMRVTDSTPHALGTMESTPEDLGLGVSALAVRHEGSGATEQVRIWFGTIAHPDPRPLAYDQPGGTLNDSEVGVGAVHHVVWTPGAPLNQRFGAVSLTQVNPTTAKPRGASAVVGMALGDLLPTPGDELVVATLSGDLIFYTANTMSELWRTHVPGAVGCYNSLQVANLDNDAFMELYVGGSGGLWRFVQPGELP
jgi:hypothetical protein